MSGTDNDMLILVDKNDNEIGTEQKLKAHKEGLLHRAFSIFIFNSEGKMLMTRRAKSKYHWGGFWSNACCSHPRQGEDLEHAAHRRLEEELGFECELKELFSIVYKAKSENGIYEHEYDHIFIGRYDGEVKADPEETDEIRWVDPEELEKEIYDSTRFTPWFQIAFAKLVHMDIENLLNEE